MSPVGVGASRFASALETGAAKLWVLLIGVDRYIDASLPSLRYAAIDCQGVGNALAAATQAFPDREFSIHHDLVAETPTLARIESSLRRIVTEAQVQDTVLLYFSGHGVLEPSTQQTVLCVRDTEREKLLSTGLQIQIVLEMLGHCAAHSQLVWLDACHSGNLNFIGRNAARSNTVLLNPTTQLLASLRQQATHSRGFYALLSCDEEQQSWEFPDLGHGVFSYYLMRGLRGEAADAQGVIDADNLYRYVYRQTVQYIDRTNQQLRLVDKEKRDRGEMSWCPEYSAQTPKRIVSGVGEIILGIQPQSSPVWLDRSALIVAAGADRLSPTLLISHADADEQIVDPLSHVLQQEGKFTLDYFPSVLSIDPDAAAAKLRHQIQTFLTGRKDRTMGSISTRLLYLKGQITALEGEDAWFVMADGVKLSRNWLAQALHQAEQIQQIIILDCPGDTAAAEWVEALKITDERGQCVIACAAPAEDAELFAQVLLEALISAPPQIGIPVASLCTRVETNLAALGIPCQFWISGTQGLIEILPATAGADSIELLAADLPNFLPPMAPPPEPFESAFVIPEITVPQERTYLQAQVTTTPPIAAAVPPEITLGQDQTEFQVEVNPTTISSAPSAFFHSVESILRRLVGPIAPTLINRVSQQSQVTDPATLVQNLLPLLPAHTRADFEQQVKSLIVGGASTLPEQRQPEPIESRPVAASTSGSGRSALTAPQSYFSPSARSAIEQTLTEAIGPVAQVLLGQIAPTAWATDRSLLAALTPYLPADRLADFAQRIQPILASPAMMSAEPPPPSAQSANGRGVESAPPAVIDDRFTIACEQALTLAIGPVAKFIIASTQKTYPHLSPADFVSALVSEIPDPVQAEAFRQKVKMP
jgi:uncharacterized caspase-like protein